MLASALQLRKKLVVLAGDTHNGWHSNITLKGLIPSGPLEGTKVGEEFATPSVSSPGFEEALSLPAAQVEAIFKGVVDEGAQTFVLVNRAGRPSHARRRKKSSVTRAASAVI